MSTIVTEKLSLLAVKYRRHLHQYPELSGQEFETYQYIKKILEELDVEILDYEAPSIVGYVKRTKGDKTIALRADIDALPIVEEGDKEYISKRPGVAHLCGHDGHTAILLATATWLAENRDEVEPNVVLIFQSSEEMSPSGAEALVAQGVLEQVDAIFGIHLMQTTPKGRIGVNHGTMMASADYFKIIVEGKGGHGGMPHETIDPIYISSQIVGGLQSIISRKINSLHPAIISVGKIEADGTYNVIPTRAILYGTVRALSEEVRRIIHSEIRQVVDGLCMSYGATGEVEYDLEGPPLTNDRKMSQYVEETVADTFGENIVEHVDPIMGGENSSYPHHHPKFDIDEEVFPSAIGLFIQLVKNFK